MIPFWFSRMAAVALLMMLTLSSAQAGGVVACNAPFIFERAAANVVPLEFLATQGDNDTEDRERLDRLQATAQRLAWLLKLDTWHQPTYGSLGAVALMFLGEKCKPDEVVQALLRGSSAPPMRAGQVLVMLSGKIFIENETVFLQSRILAFRRSDTDLQGEPNSRTYALNETLLATTEDVPSLQASLPVLDVTFEPRALTFDELALIDMQFMTANKVYSEASEDSPATELSFDPEQPIAFSVSVSDDGQWLHVEDFFGNISGFIRANPESSVFLHEKMPELDFLNGVLGYLRIRQTNTGAGDFPRPPETAPGTALERLQRFLARSDPKVEGHAQAVATAISAAIEGEVSGNWQQARTLLAQAVERDPYESRLRNLLGVVNARLCCTGGSGGEYTDPAVDFTDSLSLDPDNTQALLNLDAFLDLLAGGSGAEKPGIDMSRLAERQQVVKQAVTAAPIR